MKRLICALFLVMLFNGLFNGDISAQSPTGAEIDRRAQQIANKVVGWRRDIHEHPELGNRETRTAKIVADHLRGLGMEVRAGVAPPVSVPSSAVQRSWAGRGWNKGV